MLIRGIICILLPVRIASESLTLCCYYCKIYRCSPDPCRRLLMLFNSVGFAIFFPVVVIIYFLIEQNISSLRALRAGNLWLLAASYFYYMCQGPVYALLLFSVTLITYICGSIAGTGCIPYLYEGLLLPQEPLRLCRCFSFSNISASPAG